LWKPPDGLGLARLFAAPCLGDRSDRRHGRAPRTKKRRLRRRAL